MAKMNETEPMQVKEPIFRKALAKYYEKWFFDCHASALYCRENGDEKKAQEYLDDASKYLTIIMENWDAMNYFSSFPENAHKKDSALPEKFRGYE